MVKLRTELGKVWIGFGVSFHGNRVLLSEVLQAAKSYHRQPMHPFGSFLLSGSSHFLAANIKVVDTDLQYPHLIN